MISQARKKFPALNFEALDARQLRFNAEFDAVFSNAVLDSRGGASNRQSGAGAEIRRTIRSRVWSKGNIRRLVERFYRAFAALEMREPEALSLWFYPSIAEYAGLLERHGLEGREASLFDRPTMLAEGERGLENWIRVFRQTFIEKMGEQDAQRWIQEVERPCRGELFRDGSWVLDYLRLRLAAWKA